MVRIKFVFKKEPTSYTKKKKDIKLPNLVHIFWDITYNCPLKCEHCYAKPNRILDNELDIVEVKNFIDYLSKNGIKLITITGGEPLTRSDIFEILEYAYKKNLHISVISSGVYSKLTGELASVGVKKIQFSLDFPDSLRYDESRGFKGLYDNLLKSIKIAKETGIRTSICTTITKRNFGDISDIYDLSLKLGVDEYRLMRLMPCGISNDKYSELSIQFEEYVSLIELLADKYLSLNQPILIDVEEPYYVVENILKKPCLKDIIYYRGCLQGEAVCSITADGKIIPCPVGNYMKFIAGDIRNDDLLKVWKNSPIFKYFRDVKSISICDSCKYSAICKGGCRCAAYGCYGELNAPDPICPLSRNYNLKVCDYEVH